MILAMTLCYVMCVLIAFKVIKIRPTPVTIGISALVGIVLLGGVLIGWKMSAPITAKVTVTRNIIPLVSNQNSKELIRYSSNDKIVVYLQVSLD